MSGTLGYFNNDFVFVVTIRKNTNPEGNGGLMSSLIIIVSLLLGS